MAFDFSALVSSSFKARLLSALVLIPFVVLSIWLGHYLFAAFLGIFGGLALREFWIMVRGVRFSFGAFLLGLVYIAVSFLLCYKMREIYGAWPVVVFFGALWASDSGAYFAGKFIGGIAKLCGGGGGGRPNLAQAGGRDASKLSEALETAKSQLVTGLQ